MSLQPGVLLLAGSRPDVESLRATVAALREVDARVVLAGHGARRERYEGIELDDVHDLAAAAQAYGPAFRRELAEADGPQKVWLHVRDDEWVARRTPEISVVVWLDPRAKVAARRLASRHPHLDAVGGVPKAVERIRNAGLVKPPGEAPASRRSRLPSRARLLALAAPGLSEERRAEMAREQALEQFAAGDEEQAGRLVSAALRRIEDPRRRADLLGDVVSWALAHGRRPGLALDAYAAELAVADDHYTHGRYAEAAISFEEAMRNAFHRTLHFDGLHSPLADDPEGFTLPLRKSAVAQALHASSAAATRRAQDTEPGRPTRLLIAVRKNDDFLHEIRGHFEAHPDFDARFLDVVEVPEFERLLRPRAALVEQLLRDDGTLLQAVDDVFRPHLEWADVVFVEWCTALAALISRADSHGARLVLRVHSYEAFTQWPQLTDFSRIDDVVFVSDHLRDLARAAFPGLRGPQGPELHVIANAVDLERCRRPKPDDARFTLGVVGAQKVVKDPRWAVEVLRRLREQDERYRLLLIRGWLQDEAPGAREYADALERDLAELEPIGAVQRTGHVDDVPRILEEVGVVISSSVRESFHIGFVEGVASGAVPVVRDWPFFPGGAGRLFPPDWVVADPDDAAKRILALTASDAQWRTVGSEASRHAVDSWDWSRVSLRFEALLRR